LRPALAVRDDQQNRTTVSRLSDGFLLEAAIVDAPIAAYFSVSAARKKCVRRSAASAQTRKTFTSIGEEGATILPFAESVPGVEVRRLYLGAGHDNPTAPPLVALR
jgi:hypothetical protein